MSRPNRLQLTQHILQIAMFKARYSDCPSGSLFYTCSLNGFRGCCHFDPCSTKEGCPATHVDTTPRVPSSTLPLTSNSAKSTLLSQTSTVPPPTISPMVPTASITSIPTPPPVSSLTIAGIAVGVALLLIILLVAAGYQIRRMYLSRAERNASMARQMPPSGMSFLSLSSWLKANWF